MSNNLFMGSVYDKEFPGEDFERVTALMRQTSKDSFPKCVKCWAKKLCSPCYGDTFAASGTLSAPRESICTIIRSVAKATLLKVAEFMTDAEKWKRFVGNVSRSDATLHGRSDAG
jgi:radical SAM protein with 4Fe4S-binding SPASM domain